MRQNEKPCPSDSEMKHLCDPGEKVTGCVQGGVCTSVRSDVSVCCVPKTQSEKPDAGR